MEPSSKSLSRGWSRWQHSLTPNPPPALFHAPFIFLIPAPTVACFKVLIENTLLYSKCLPPLLTSWARLAGYYCRALCLNSMLMPHILFRFGWCLPLLQWSFHHARLIALYGVEDYAGCQLRVSLTSFHSPFGIRGPPLPTSRLNSGDSHGSREGPVTQPSDNVHPSYILQ